VSASSFRFASRFPLVLLCGLIGTAAAIAGWAGQAQWDRDLRIVMTAALGMPLFFALSMLAERGNRRMWLMAPAGILMLAAYYHWMTPQSSEMPMIVQIQWALVFVGLDCFAAASAPTRGPGDGSFWQFNCRIRSMSGETWARWFCKIFPWALAPLSLLLLLSLRERIAAYGVTESRYLGVVSGFWIAVWALVSMVRQDAGIRWIPASLAGICLAAAIGPWSAGTISRDSQYRRVTKLFRAHGLMIADQFHAPREALELSAEEGQTIDSAVQYLVKMHGAESLHRLFGRFWKGVDWPNLAQWNANPEIWLKMNLRSSGGDEETESVYFLKRDEVFTIEGFRRATYINFYGFTANQAHGWLTFGDEGLQMQAPDETEAEPVPVEAFLRSLPESVGRSSTAGQMTLNWTQKVAPTALFSPTFRSGVKRESRRISNRVRACYASSEWPPECVKPI
jgi:hypothetical protein